MNKKMILGILLLALISGAVGFMVADGVPTTINLSESQKNNFILAEQRECDNRLDKLDEDRTRCFELYKESFEIFDGKLDNFKDDIEFDVKSILNSVQDLNITIKDLNHTVYDYNTTLQDFNVCDWNR